MRKGIQVVLKIVIITCSLVAVAQNSSLKKGSVNAKNYYEEIELKVKSRNGEISDILITKKKLSTLLDDFNIQVD